MATSKSRKLLARGKSTGIPELDIYIYGVQLTLVAMLLEGKACMKGSAYLQTGGQFRINPEGLVGIRSNLIEMATSVNRQWSQHIKEAQSAAGKARYEIPANRPETQSSVRGEAEKGDSAIQEVEPEWMRKGRERAERMAARKIGKVVKPRR